MLMARDPILFWDEIPLYESELDDNGVSQLQVKARLFHHVSSVQWEMLASFRCARYICINPGTGRMI